VTALLNKIMPKLIQYLIAELRHWNLLEIINDFWRRIEKVKFSVKFIPIHSIHFHSFPFISMVPIPHYDAVFDIYNDCTR
jgi:hypothetical protein